MSITLNYSHLSSREFVSAMEKINRAPGLSGKAISRYSKIRNHYETLGKAWATDERKLIEKHGVREPVMIEDPANKEQKIQKLDDKGEPMTKVKVNFTPQGPTFDINDMASFQKDKDEASAEHATVIEANKIPVDDWMMAHLTPAEYIAAEAILEPVPEDGEAEVKKLDLVKG